MHFHLDAFVEFYHGNCVGGCRCAHHHAYSSRAFAEYVKCSGEE